MAKDNSSSDLYQRTTDRIIAALEQGTAPWIKPWRGSTQNGLPTNLSTGQEYRGINIVTLWSASVARGFEHDLWITYKQAQERGWQVRKGAKSEYIVKAGRAEKEVDGQEKPVSFNYLRSYCVFNIAEVDGAPLPQAEELTEHERIARAEAFIAATGAIIREGGDRACYYRAGDEIALPQLGRFECANSYYATLVHELTHWTGAEKRLDRQFGKRFADEAYAVEELCAEMGSAFLCAHLGIEGHLQHPQYISHWLRVLGQDKRAIFTAAAKASQAADYIRGFSEAAKEVV